jgi:putative hemolysin
MPFDQEQRDAGKISRWKASESRSFVPWTAQLLLAFALISLGLWAAPFDTEPAVGVALPQPLSPAFVLAASLLLLALSAFFSASEVAFYSLHQVRLRQMRESGGFLNVFVTRLMEHPSNLLTTILMGNCIVNVLLGVVLATRVEEALEKSMTFAGAAGPVLSYALAVTITTGLLVFFGEITPKVLAVRRAEQAARWAALPLYGVDRILSPLRKIMIRMIGFFFRVSRFSEVPPAPFMTDEEFASLLSDGEASGVIEEDERQMIQGILDFSDVMLRDILVPRPDMATLPKTANVSEALAAVRAHDRSRIPVHGENLDDIHGVLYAKDLLPYVAQGAMEHPIKSLLRKTHFVPETMSVADFLKDAQRLRIHLAVVVDEFGGTEGLVTLQDALREVVGDIAEKEEDPLYTQDSEGAYRVDGNLPLDDLEDLLQRPIEAEEHATVAGFILEQLDKIPEVGDRIEAGGVSYTIESLKDKRIAQVRLQEQPVDEEGETL